MLIGLSTHDEAQLAAAVADPDIDYFCVGPVWETPDQGRVAPGWASGCWSARSTLAPPFAHGAPPWFVTGGVAPQTLDDVLATGARRVVVVRAITRRGRPGSGVAASCPGGCGGGRLVRHLTYLACSPAACSAAAPLEIFLRAAGLARWQRLLLTLVPVVRGLRQLGRLRDLAPSLVLRPGDRPPGCCCRAGLPLEELLFFLVIPVCAVLTLEAVRKVTGWSADAEPANATRRAWR